ncbi:hypothetical protein CNMCM6936_004477 [Aspergillus lentulus]|uniref:Uncharacterized protein n=1 Tax=Aspergillus lentulus TaxID=293939 RepID=A0AAN6BKP7_ASPLE|nr:hypothetical protein CNMCM6936_004477 [Aspergillus lentulus]KAF4170826.1 hypothetical protein CNMCM8060_004226 [Aspergillus lentulus]KAF4176778.1 hypothetical protein CNMCM7927_003876 [Aspergillus lentulus]KAF4191081.1 hypothetical protein CNMCM8694_002378 [Aspergillus lentulus]KAF4200053.1 hypothetical protein CNMCM8927_004029 [Aspergillus lentulus]
MFTVSSRSLIVLCPLARVRFKASAGASDHHGAGAGTASPGAQPTIVMAELSQAATARSARMILKPHIVVRPAREARRAPPEPMF